MSFSLFISCSVSESKYLKWKHLKVNVRVKFKLKLIFKKINEEMWLSFLLSVTYVSIVLLIARHHLIINLTMNKLLVPLSSTPIMPITSASTPV